MVERNSEIIRNPRRGISSEWAPATLVERSAQMPIQQQLTISDIWLTVAKRKWTVLGFAIVVFALVAAYTFTRVPVYEGVARLQIDPTRSTNLGLDDGDKGTSGGPDADSHIKTEVTIIQSDAVAMRVINSLKLFADPTFAGKDVTKSGVEDMGELSPTQRERLLSKFNSNLTVRVIPNTQIVEIRFRSSNPLQATHVANSVIDEYVRRNFLARVDGTAQISQWLSKQLEEIKASTNDSQKKLADFQQQNGLLGADESDNIVTDRLKQLNDELTQSEADRIVKEGRYRLALSGKPELIDSTLSNTSLQALRTQQADLQAQYAQLSAKFGGGYPKLRELQSQLAQVNSAIESEGYNIQTRLANEFGAASRTETMIRQEFSKQKSEAYKLNEHVSQYATLKHEVESGQHLYDTLQLRLKEAGISSGLMSSFVSVIDRARIPDRPVEPKKSLYLALGLGGGMLGGLILGLVLESTDKTVRNSEDLEAILVLPELGTVPFLQVLSTKDAKKAPKARPLFSSRSTFSPLALREPNSPGVEAYRALCSAILSASRVDDLKTLVITSPTSGEGKSTVSCNLATALAQRGRRVLLADADLRSSSIHPQLGVRAGLTTMAAAGAENHPRYQPLAHLPNLHVVPAGIRPSDPSGLLDSTRMQDLLESWKEDYDYIIIDTPPALPFADALVLGAKADGVILVARSGVSEIKAMIRARDSLTRSGANLLGFVLNAAKDREVFYRYPPGYGQLSEKDVEQLPRV